MWNFLEKCPFKAFMFVLFVFLCWMNVSDFRSVSFCILCVNSLCVHVCVPVAVTALTCSDVYAHTWWRSTMADLPQVLPTLCFWDKVSYWSGIVDGPGPSVPLYSVSLPLQHWGYKLVPLCPAFPHHFWRLNSALLVYMANSLLIGAAPLSLILILLWFF